MYISKAVWISTSTVEILLNKLSSGATLGNYTYRTKGNWPHTRIRLTPVSDNMVFHNSFVPVIHIYNDIEKPKSKMVFSLSLAVEVFLTILSAFAIVAECALLSMWINGELVALFPMFIPLIIMIFLWSITVITFLYMVKKSSISIGMLITT